MDPKLWLDWLNELAGVKGTAGILMAILVSGYLEVWVWGKAYRRKCAESNRWQQLALSNTTLARESLALFASKEKD